TRMVIEHGERVTALAGTHRKMSFEVHLPKVIGSGMFEAAKRAMLGRFGRFNQAVALQHRVDCTGRRHIADSDVAQAFLDLAASPGRVFLPHRDDGVLHVFRRLPRLMGGTARTIEQAVWPFGSVTSNPFA